MPTLQEIDKEIRALTKQDPESRPFVCEGSPIGCEVAEVGINPGTPTPFWPYWNPRRGFDKAAWLNDYVQRQGHVRPTRARIEIFCQALYPLRCLELNLFPRYSPSESTLAVEHRDTGLFDYLLKTLHPHILVIHGKTPAKYLQSLLGIQLEKDRFVTTTYLGVPLEVVQAQRHFAYVSKEYVRQLASRINERIRKL